MIRKHNLYQIATIAWGVLVFGVVILTISGNARPFLSPEALPIDGPIQMVAVAVALTALGFLVIRQLEKRDWTAAGKQAGLSPESGSVIGNPDLVGTVDGRTVRARTESHNVGGGGESGSDTKTVTVVETDLSEPTERALIVTPGGAPTAGGDDLPTDLADQMTAVGDVAVLGESEDLAYDVLTPRARDAISRLDTTDGVHAGKTVNIYLDAVEDASGGVAGSFAGLMADKLADRMPGGAEKVGTEIEGVVLNGAELERRVDAVAAVANGFEEATDGESGTRLP